MYGNVPVGNPVCCPPIYNVRDYCTPCIIPVVQPVVNLNRQHVIRVPQVVYQQSNRNVVVPANNFATPGNFGSNNALFNNVGNNAGFNNRLF